MRITRSGIPTFVTLGLAVVALVGVGVGTATSRDAPSHTTASTLPPAAPALAIAGERGGQIPWDRVLRIEVSHGTVEDVAVTDDQGRPVQGAVTDAGTAWESTSALSPLASYTMTASILDSHRRRSLRMLTVRTSDTDRHLVATISPGDNDVVGVGMPVAVTFNRPVPRAARAAVLSHLSVTTSPDVTGAWHWLSATEVHWRPPEYWSSGTQVTVHTDLSHLDIGGGVFGTGAHTSQFRIGAAHVSVADAASHTMTVTADSQVVRVIPMSAGRDQYPTRGGVHIALEKQPVVTMDSQTVGIPRDSPDGYYEKVFWDVRISNGGAFVHAAPWSVGDQGQRNVSHGCINVSPADAEWFYNFSRRGDIVNVVHAAASPDLSDPGMSDWNMSWSAWTADSTHG